MSVYILCDEDADMWSSRTGRAGCVEGAVGSQ